MIMSDPFQHLGCGQRCVIHLAQRRTPDLPIAAILAAAHRTTPQWPQPTGAACVSVLVDLARQLQLAQHGDVTRNPNRALQAFQAENIRGLLACWERLPTLPTIPNAHVSVIRHIAADTVGLLVPVD